MNRLLAAFIIALLYSCQTSQTLTTNNLNLLIGEEHTIYIYQNSKERKIDKKLETIDLEKKPFSIRCYNKTYNLNTHNSTQIAVFLTDNEFNKIKTGASIKNTPCFSPGTGYAMYNDGSDKYFLFETDSSDGHHYLYYENVNSRRLNLIEDLGDVLKLEFEVNQFLIRNPDNTITETPIYNTNINKFFLAILIDRNLNDTIDINELHKLKINFK